MALTMLLSAAASGSLEMGPVRLTRAAPPDMSRSMSVPSGMTVRRPSRAASMSLCGEETIMASVARAMPSWSGISRMTGTR